MRYIFARVLLYHMQVEDLVVQKFQYIVACQVYGRMKKNQDPKADDIEMLLARFPSLRVAYIDEVRCRERRRCKCVWECLDLWRRWPCGDLAMWRRVSILGYFSDPCNLLFFLKCLHVRLCEGERSSNHTRRKERTQIVWHHADGLLYRGPADVANPSFLTEKKKKKNPGSSSICFQSSPKCISLYPDAIPTKTPRLVNIRNKITKITEPNTAWQLQYCKSRLNTS